MTMAKKDQDTALFESGMDNEEYCDNFKQGENLLEAHHTHYKTTTTFTKISSLAAKQKNLAEMSSLAAKQKNLAAANRVCKATFDGMKTVIWLKLMMIPIVQS
jgi:hypothetical protein